MTGDKDSQMNANDHVPMVNIMPFGFCKKGMPCMPLTPLAWVDVNKKHIIDGAPALTEDSKLACFHGGVITIVPLNAGSAEEGYRNDDAEDVVEEIGSIALNILAAIVTRGKAGKFSGMKGVKKNSVSGGGNKGKGSGGDVSKKPKETVEDHLIRRISQIQLKTIFSKKCRVIGNIHKIMVLYMLEMQKEILE